VWASLPRNLAAPRVSWRARRRTPTSSSRRQRARRSAVPLLLSSPEKLCDPRAPRGLTRPLADVAARHFPQPRRTPLPTCRRWSPRSRRCRQGRLRAGQTGPHVGSSRAMWSGGVNAGVRRWRTNDRHGVKNGQPLSRRHDEVPVGGHPRVEYPEHPARHSRLRGPLPTRPQRKFGHLSTRRAGGCPGRRNASYASWGVRGHPRAAADLTPSSSTCAPGVRGRERTVRRRDVRAVPPPVPRREDRPPWF